MGAVHVARPEGAAFDIAKLVEHEQRVITHAAEVPIVGALFLLAIGRALARIHVEHDSLRRSPPVHLSIHRPGRSARAARFSGRLSHFVSKRPIWLAEAADPLISLRCLNCIPEPSRTHPKLPGHPANAGLNGLNPNSRSRGRQAGNR
jgi:hypothetical protein